MQQPALGPDSDPADENLKRPEDPKPNAQSPATDSFQLSLFLRRGLETSLKPD
jgi:hypothetical protein